MNSQLFQKLEPYFEETLSLGRNEFLVIKGKRCADIFYVENGSLRVFIEDENEEHTIRFGYKKSFITALDSFIKDEPTIFYIQAIRKSTIKRISKKNYVNFLQSSDENKLLWQQIQQELIYQQLEREIDIITFSPQKRLERVLQRSPQLFQEIPQKYIASYLRMTPETLSRTLKNLDLNQ